MRERPPHVDDGDVVESVRRLWDADVDRVRYLPVGFGAHHWAAYAGAQPLLFVTFDEPGGPEPAAELEAAYAGAVSLQDDGLEFVLAPVRTNEGGLVAAFSDGVLSVTPWLDGSSQEPLDLRWTVDVLHRLHTTTPPPGLPVWRPKVGPDFAESTARLTEQCWGPGPYADTARDAVRRRLSDIERWTRRYHHLGDLARGRTWVAAHGEPHEANQVQTAEGRFLVDWDTLRLAPAELDLRTLVEAGLPAADVGADPEMVELFDLEWRLDEISQYVAWFAAPHPGGRDDEIAIGGLRHELTRP
jgi:spectinomycin phosphotransferase